MSLQRLAAFWARAHWRKQSRPMADAAVGLLMPGIWEASTKKELRGDQASEQSQRSYSSSSCWEIFLRGGQQKLSVYINRLGKHL